jgi:integrase
MPRGSKTERAPSVWDLRWDLPRGPDEKRRQASSVFKGGAREADRELARRVAEAERGAVTPARLTLEAYLAQWLAANAHLAPNTIALYGYQAKRLTAGLGNVLLARLSPFQIQAHYAKELETQAASSVNLQHAVLRRALRQARRWKLLAYNPTDDVDAPRFTPPDVHALSPADLRRLLDAARDTTLYAPLVVAILTGIRKGELLGLWWTDLEGARLSVRRQLLRAEGGGLRYGPPKSPTSRRSLTLPALALEELAAHRQAQARLRSLVPDWTESDLMFPAETGLPWHPSTFSGAYRRLREVAGFPDCRFHDLRHSALSLLHSLGVSQKVVMQRAGHASPSMTNRYLHVLPGQDAEAAERLDQAFREAPAGDR